MKTRETKKQQKTDVILSEATDGINKVRLIGTALAEEKETCPWEEIDAYSGRFVVAGYRFGGAGDTSNNYLLCPAYSTDGGETWTPSTTTSDENQIYVRLRALAYGGGRFVVAGYRYNDSGDDSNNHHPWIAYSTDGGETWTSSTTTDNETQAYGELHALAYGGGRFVVAGFSYDGKDGNLENFHPWLAYSVDGGETWTPSTTTSDENQPHGELHALAYGGGRFVVAGYRFGTSGDDSDDYHPWIAYSTDGGATWTPNTTTSDETQAHGQLHALAYGGGRFVVAGFSYDTSEGTSDDYHPWIAYSTDGGKTWKPNTTTSDETQAHGQLHALAYGGGRFVVAGYRFGTSGDDSNNYHPWIAYSTDGGATWTPNTTTDNETQPYGPLQALAYGGGRFVVAGFSYDGDDDSPENYHPWIAYSTDGGETWTRNKTTTNENQRRGVFRALTYAPDSYCWKFG